MSREQMRSVDAAWLHMDRPTNLTVVNTVIWFGEPLDLPRVRERLRRGLVDEFPRFRQRVVESRMPAQGPWWEDDAAFDLESHVHELVLPAPGDEDALQQFIAETMAKPLDRSRPLWEIHLIDGYGAGSALLWRVHHCIADGIALARVLLSITDEPHNAGIAPATGASRGSDWPSMLAHGAARAVTDTRRAVEAVWHESLEIMSHPSAMTDLAAVARDDATAAAKVLLTGHEADNILTGEPGVARRVAWTSALPVEEVKAIAHPSGATVNDALLAAVAGALRTYLMRRQSLVDEISAIVPFNLRPLDEPLPRELGNQFGLVLVQLPVGIDSPLERLATVKQRMDRIKRTPEGTFTYGFLGALGLSPVQLANVFVERFASRGTAVITNVAGPRERMRIAGQPVLGAVLWAPCSAEVGVSISIFSTAEEVRVGLAVDAGLVAEPQEIIDAIQVEYDELRRLRHRSPDTRGLSASA